MKFLFLMAALIFCLGNAECQNPESVINPNVDFRMIGDDGAVELAEFNRMEDEEKKSDDVIIDISPGAASSKVSDAVWGMILVFVALEPADIARLRGTAHRFDFLADPPVVVIRHLFLQQSLIPRNADFSEANIRRLYRAMFRAAALSSEVFYRIQRGSMWRAERLFERDNLLDEIRTLTSGIESQHRGLPEVRTDLSTMEQELAPIDCFQFGRPTAHIGADVHNAAALTRSYLHFLRNASAPALPQLVLDGSDTTLGQIEGIMFYSGGGPWIRSWRDWIDGHESSYLGLWCEKSSGGCVAAWLMLPISLIDKIYVKAFGSGKSSPYDTSDDALGFLDLIAYAPVLVASKFAEAPAILLLALPGTSKPAAVAADFLSSVVHYGAGAPLGFALGAARASGLAAKTAWFGVCRVVGGIVDCLSCVE